MALFDNYLGGQVQTPEGITGNSPVFGSGDSVVSAWNGVRNGLQGRRFVSQPKDWFRVRQPWRDDAGRACVTVTDLEGQITRNDSTGGEPKYLLRSYLAADLFARGYPIPLFTLNASLLMRDWIQLDTRVVRAFRQELRATADLESAGLTYGGFNAMGKTVLEYHAMSDPGEAVVDIDARVDGRNDMPLNILRAVPLPITHADFGYSQRELMVSRNGDTPLDTTLGEAGGRRVAESVEDQILGNITGVTYGTQTTGYGTHTGTSTVYGYTNFPQRLIKSNFTAPTTTNGPTTYAEVLAAIQQLLVQYHRGPYVLYHSLDWNPYMHSPFSTAGGNHPSETLRTMLLKIPQITDVRLLERLTSTYTFIFVAMNNMVVELVNGMDITTVQWEEKGGLELRFKVMCIKVPRLKSDYNSRTGILHGTTA